MVLVSAPALDPSSNRGVGAAATSAPAPTAALAAVSPPAPATAPGTATAGPRWPCAVKAEVAAAVGSTTGSTAGNTACRTAGNAAENTWGACRACCCASDITASAGATPPAPPTPRPPVSLPPYPRLSGYLEEAFSTDVSIESSDDEGNVERWDDVSPKPSSGETPAGPERGEGGRRGGKRLSRKAGDVAEEGFTGTRRGFHLLKVWEGGGGFCESIF